MPAKPEAPSLPNGYRERWLRLAVPAALVALTVVAYLPALRAGYVWDDDQYVTANPLLMSAWGLRRIWLDPRALPQYYPLVFSTFWIEHRLWGLWPVGYHLVNVLLHALAALLFARVLGALGVPGSWLAGLLFALHPVHVESVAWVTERKNVLSGVLYLVALSCALRALDLVPPRRPPADASRRPQWWLALLSFTAALLSKTVTCSLPVALLLICWWKRRRLSAREAAWLAPFFVLGAALGLHTAWLERHHVGAIGREWALSSVQRWLVAGRAWWFYLRKLAWPADLSFIYPRWDPQPEALAQHLFPLAALLALALLFALRGRLGRGPATAFGFFTVTLAPALGIFDVYPMRFSFVADHFQYLASMGPLALAAALLVGGGRWRLPAAAAGVALGALALVLALSVSRQAAVYRDPRTLWTDTLAKNPQSWLALNNLGGILLGEGRNAEAAHRFAAAVRLKPDYTEAYSNLGFALSRLGRLDEAVQACEAALRSDPRFVPAYLNLGRAQARQQRLEDAVQSFRTATALAPSSAEAWIDLGRALALQGRYAESVAPFTQALRARPDDVETRRELSWVLAQTGGRSP